MPGTAHYCCGIPWRCRDVVKARVLSRRSLWSHHKLCLISQAFTLPSPLPVARGCPGTHPEIPGPHAGGRSGVYLLRNEMSTSKQLWRRRTTSDLGHHFPQDTILRGLGSVTEVREAPPAGGSGHGFQWLPTMGILVHPKQELFQSLPPTMRGSPETANLLWAGLDQV